MLFALAATGGSLALQPPPPAADLVVLNAKILTVDEQFRGTTEQSATFTITVTPK